MFTLSVKVCFNRLLAFVYKITMSILIKFVEWIKAEAEETDDLIIEDARIKRDLEPKLLFTLFTT